MNRVFITTIIIGLFFFACNKEHEKGLIVNNCATIVTEESKGLKKNYEALHDTLDSLNTLLFRKIKAADVVLMQTSAPGKKTTVEARTALWPLYAN